MNANELLQEVKNYLDITWEDPQGDKKLMGIISMGMAYLQRLTLRALTYEEGTTERALLFNYCRYERSGARDDFGNNYRTDIITFTMDEAAK